MPHTRRTLDTFKTKLPVIILFSLANFCLLRLGPGDRAVKADLKQSDVTFSLRRQLLELSMMLSDSIASPRFLSIANLSKSLLPRSKV